MKLRNTVFIAIFATALISIISLLLVQQFKFSYAFNNYFHKNRIERIDKLHTRLTELYAKRQSWAFIDNQNHILPSDKHNKRAIDFNFMPGVALLDADNNILKGKYSPDMTLTDIYFNHERVGLLAVKDKNKVKAALDNRFIKQQIKTLFIATLFSLLTALIFAYFLSRKLTKPIFDIASVLTSLRKGDLTSRSQYKHSNELGRLAADLNVLANTLEQNQDTRQRWIADISHELRTPITIMLGELECLEDGLTSFDHAAVTSLKEEASALYKLVADLHQLTQADQGELRLEFQANNVSEIVNGCLQKYQPIFQQREISVDNKLPPILMAYLDKSRLQQVFINLFENCARYTDKLGNVMISAHQDNDSITLVIKNSAPKLSEESLSKLFDRLYRVDGSRNKVSGGSGLGLAICAAIIEAHNGKISVANSSSDCVIGNSLAISITLPVRSSSAFQTREFKHD